MKTVYVASKSEHGAMWRGFRPNWEKLGFHIISTWIDESEPGQTASFEDLWIRCIEEASEADFLIAMHVEGETWKGAFIEIGAALAWGKNVYVLGNPPGSWVNHPQVELIVDPIEALGQESW